MARKSQLWFPNEITNVKEIHHPETEIDQIVGLGLQRSKAYILGDIAYSGKLPSYLHLECTTAGTTAATEPTITGKVEGNTITDGTAVWTVKKFGSSGGKREPFLSATAVSSDGYTYNISRRGNGAITAVSSNTSVGTVSVSGTTVTVTPVADGDITVTVSVAETNEYYSDSVSVSVTVNCSINVCGIALLNPGGGAGTWTRVDPDGDGLPTQNFSELYPWNGIETVTIDGQTMVKIPKFYVKYGEAAEGSEYAGKKCHWVSDKALPGYHIHPAFVKNGYVMDCFYIGAYEAYNAGSSKAGSAASQTPWVNIGGHAKAIAYCNARNTNTDDTAKRGWHLQNIYEVAAVNILMMIELETPNVQTAIAAGNVSSSAAQATGATAAVWRDLHEWWGNVWEHVDGLTVDANGLYQIFSTQGDGTYVNTGISAPSEGWITEMSEAKGTNFDMTDVFVPSATNGTESNGTYGDYMWKNNSTVLYRSGEWVHGSQSGAFTFYVAYGASYSYGTIGLRLAKEGTLTEELAA